MELKVVTVICRQVTEKRIYEGKALIKTKSA